MEDLAFVVDLVLAVVTAFVGGIVAQRLRQPVILGYLLAGVVIGPFTPGPKASQHTVEVLAEIGVAFLMFAVGAEVSVAELRRLGRVAGLGGAVQIGGTMLLGPLLAPALGLSPVQGVFLGGVLALSSTVVALKLLMARGEAQALHGRVALGILVAQDLAVVPMVVVLPALASGSTTLFFDLGTAALKAGAILAGAYLVGARAVPWILGHAAAARTRELFLLGVVGLALGTALVTEAAGLSLAFGAFLAGVVVAESGYRVQVVAEVLPLRDLFASLFFVSVGMLIDPPSFVALAGEIALVSGVVLVGKVVIAAFAVLALGMPGRVAVMAALALAQVGEFSFVLARIGVAAGAVPAEIFDLTLAVALVTIVPSPAVLALGGPLVRWLERVPLLQRRFRPGEAAPAAAGADDMAALRGHAVICGYGRVARELSDALEKRGVTYVVVEFNPLIVQALRAAGQRVLYGDAANPTVLEHAHLEHARLLAVLMPDAAATEAATREARRMNPRLDIVARARDSQQVALLQRAGATDVVQPEFEAGVEVIRHAMRRFGVSSQELVLLTAGRRRRFYEQQPPDAA
jgi:CPA2 family monovalent cation:H+ antiporter-2